MQKIFLFAGLAVLSYIFFKSENILLLCAGIAIFIFGMVIMGEGFKNSGGGTLELFLRRQTSTKLRSIIFGTAAAAVMQSSTLVSLLSISFLSAGFISLVQGVGIIFGSQIGTTSGAWLIAGLGIKVDIAKYAMPLIIFGVIFLLQSSKKFKSVGQVFIGIGLLFLGVAYIKDGFEAIGNDFNLAQYSIEGMTGIIIFSLLGIVIAIITQSSLATIVLTIAALNAEQVSYMNALGIIIGANIGTTLTGIVSSLGSNVDGKRLAFLYLIFNLFIGAISLIFIYQIVALIKYEAIILGIGEDNYALKLALFHTTINLLGVILLYSVMENIASLAQKIIRQKTSAGDDVLYLSSSITHENAIREAARKEICHLYENAANIMVLGIHVEISDLYSEKSADETIKLRSKELEFDYEQMYQKKIKTIYGKIVNFIVISQSTSENENIVKDLTQLQKAAQGIVEALKDLKHLQKNLTKYMISPNSGIKNGYNAIREHLLTQFRILDKIFKSEEEDLVVVLMAQLEMLGEKFEKNAALMLGTLLKSGTVSPLMGSSLMNDNAYALHISKSLIEAAKILFIHKDSGQKETMKAVFSKNDEIEEIQ
ncbi:MAG: Na/Pi symporter [Campylobacteraceae bacterium]|nr:Na/Pi symporter [Campylobacteraceae bacterium]